MTLNTSVDDADERIRREQQRKAALLGLREKHFEFEPAAHQFVTFWVLDLEDPKGSPRPVQAMKNFNTVNGWRWIGLDDELRRGHWNQLIAEVTEGSLFPTAASAGHGTVFEFA
jgi:hypothetical protein